MNLPHRFPFRWIERTAEGVGRVVVTANSTWLRGDTPVPAPFFAELVAQTAAVLLQGPDSEAQQRWLAGIDRLEMYRTVHAGEVLEISVSAGRRFGNALQVNGVISSGGKRIGEAVLLLV